MNNYEGKTISRSDSYDHLKPFSDSHADSFAHFIIKKINNILIIFYCILFVQLFYKCLRNLYSDKKNLKNSLCDCKKRYRPVLLPYSQLSDRTGKQPKSIVSTECVLLFCNSAGCSLSASDGAGSLLATWLRCCHDTGPQWSRKDPTRGCCSPSELGREEERENAQPVTLL